MSTLCHCTSDCCKFFGIRNLKSPLAILWHCLLDLRLAILAQCRLMTDRQMNRQAHNDSITTASSASITLHGKNKPVFLCYVMFLPHNGMLEQYMLLSYVRPSVCLSQACTVPKWLNVGSRKQCHTIAQGH